MSKISTATCIGTTAFHCDVECSLHTGLTCVDILGLAEGAVREAKVRVRAAIANMGETFPIGRVALNISTPRSRNEGTWFDLPLALAVLIESGAIPQSSRADDTLFIGELSLAGDIRPVRGAILAAEAAVKAGKKAIVMAAENANEAAWVDGIDVLPARTLGEVARWIAGQDALSPAVTRTTTEAHWPDLKDVRGSQPARRALEIAAAGGHNLLLVGGPGAGKTMLARRMPGILPPLQQAEAMELTRVMSVAGLNIGGGLVTRRPFRAPHHSTTAAGLVGGGAPLARPGEVSLAHHGVLFLDEIVEFQRTALDYLREPLSSREVALARASGTVVYPADALVVAAMNPCPCGYYGTGSTLRCRCSTETTARYKARAATLMGMFDLRVTVDHVDVATLTNEKPGESSETVRARVVGARERQHARQGSVNARLVDSALQTHVMLDGAGSDLYGQTADALSFDAKTRASALRVARTIADLAGATDVGAAHMAEALSLLRPAN